MEHLPENFKERMRRELGEDYPRFIDCYEKPPVRGLRVNTLKISPGEFMEICPWELEKTPILPEGFTVRGAENVGRHPYHAAGLFYMQEPSAMSAIAAAGADKSGLRVLDMCAAPGGKTGGIAARMGGRGIIVANEIVPKRAKLLAQNVERLGITNAAVICERPDNIAAALPGFFDIVAVDAPCSGEGMFRKDEGAIAEWSPEHVSACAERQKMILESAAECVAPGGRIVYSTCTFSREENEGVIEDFLSRHGEFEPELTERLYPHTSCGEGHFVCTMKKVGISYGNSGESIYPSSVDDASPRRRAARPEEGGQTVSFGNSGGSIHPSSVDYASPHRHLPRPGEGEQAISHGNSGGSIHPSSVDYASPHRHLPRPGEGEQTVSHGNSGGSIYPSSVDDASPHRHLPRPGEGEQAVPRGNFMGYIRPSSVDDASPRRRAARPGEGGQTVSHGNSGGSIYPSSVDDSSPRRRAARPGEVRGGLVKDQLELLNAFMLSTQQNGLPDGVLFAKNDTVRLIPRDMPEAVLSLHPVACGVELGQLKKGRFEPSHTYFMARMGQDFIRSLSFEPGDKLLAAFLAGGAIPCPEDWRGWSAVCVKAGSGCFPIGFGKAVDGIMKNHLPKGLYIN